MSMTINSNRYNPSIYSNYNSKNNDKSAQRMASSKRINSAADDAAGLAISEKLQSIINGLGKGTENSYDMQNLLNTADGGLSNVTDSLQRVRELSVQAQNGIYNDSDKALLQNEASQLLDNIDKTASSTQFNNKNLLDGSVNSLHTASYADGSGADISIGSVSTSSLGISGFDVSKNADISAIDKAMSEVSETRSSIGANSNRLDSTISYTQKSETDQSEALSRVSDTDYGKEVIKYSTSRVLEQYRNFSLKQQMNNMGSLVNLML